MDTNTVKKPAPMKRVAPIALTQSTGSGFLDKLVGKFLNGATTGVAGTVPNTATKSFTIRGDVD